MLPKVVNHIVMVSCKGLYPAVTLNGIAPPSSISVSRRFFLTPPKISTPPVTPTAEDVLGLGLHSSSVTTSSKVRNEDGFAQWTLTSERKRATVSCFLGKHLLTSLLCLSLWESHLKIIASVSQGVYMKLFQSLSLYLSSSWCFIFGSAPRVSWNRADCILTTFRGSLLLKERIWFSPYSI